MSRRRRGPAPTLSGKHRRENLMSAINAAAVVMARTDRPLRLWELLARMKRQGLWSTTSQTPKSAIAAVLRRELALGPRSRIREVGDGLYTLADAPVRVRGLGRMPRTDSPSRAPRPARRSDCEGNTTPASPPTDTASPGH